MRPLDPRQLGEPRLLRRDLDRVPGDADTVVDRLRPRLGGVTPSGIGVGARDGGRMVFVQRCLSEAQLVMNLRVGARLPLLTSAVGWGLLAGYDPAEREELIAEYAGSDPRWPQAEPAFRGAMGKFAGCGYILNLGVFHSGYNTAAVPIMGDDGRPAFALSCAGSAVTHSPAFLRREVAPELLAVARRLSRLSADGTGAA